MGPLARLRELGYSVSAEGDDIVCRWQGDGEPTPAAVLPAIEELRKQKAEALAELKACELPEYPADWPEFWRDSFLQRAGIMEFDGHVPKAEAQARAEELVREAHRRATTQLRDD